MKTKLDEQSLDWALTHICRYCDSDHFPRAFEFTAIRQNWKEVKDHILAINLETYTPRKPLIRFAPKLGGTHRIVHRLDPIDSLIYTAMAHEIQRSMGGSGDPQTARIAPSRVEPDSDGSFYRSARNAWQQHLARVESLAQKYKGGYILMADIHDFFCQIQPRRLAQLLVESRLTDEDHARVISHFLLALSPSSARGIPVGPSASSVLSEVVGASIDREVLKHAGDHTRWVDDLLLFFGTREAAHDGLRNLSNHLHTAHELIFSPEKTRIVSTGEFLANHHMGPPEETVAAGPAEERLGQIAGRWRPMALYYAWKIATPMEAVPMTLHVQMQSLSEFQIIGGAYLLHFNKAVNCNPPNLRDARRILRKAAAYRIRDLLPGVLDHFDQLMPAIRETGIYLKSVLNADDIRTHEAQLRRAWQNAQQGSSYINDWMCHAFSHPGFDQNHLPADYSSIISIRNQALIALRKQDVDWVRKHAAQLETFEPWDRRAIVYACSLLPPGERAKLLGAAQGHGEILERSVALYLQPSSDRAAASADVKPLAKGPDNYPSYGDKPATKAPDNYPSYGDKPEAKAPDHYPAYHADEAPDHLKLLKEIEELTLTLADQANRLRDQQAATADNKTALDQKDAEIKSLNDRLSAIEQIISRLSKPQSGQDT
jgi:hypothetical protein